MQARPAGLLLRQWQASGVPHDLAHARMAEQVWMHGCRLADPPVAGGAQRQDPDIRSLRSSFHDLPGSHPIDRSPLTIHTALAGEEQRLVVL